MWGVYVGISQPFPSWQNAEKYKDSYTDMLREQFAVN